MKDPVWGMAVSADQNETVYLQMQFAPSSAVSAFPELFRSADIFQQLLDVLGRKRLVCYIKFLLWQPEPLLNSAFKRIINRTQNNPIEITSHVQPDSK